MIPALLMIIVGAVAFCMAFPISNGSSFVLGLYLGVTLCAWSYSLVNQPRRDK